jgi:hypothetical protein
MRLEACQGVDGAHHGIRLSVARSHDFRLRVAFVRLTEDRGLRRLGETTTTPGRGYCSKLLVDHCRRSAIPHRLGQAGDACIGRTQYNEVMGTSDTVERFIPAIIAFDLIPHRRDLEIAERNIGEQRRELREKRQERFA